MGAHGDEAEQWCAGRRKVLGCENIAQSAGDSIGNVARELGRSEHSAQEPSGNGVSASKL